MKRRSLIFIISLFTVMVPAKLICRAEGTVAASQTQSAGLPHMEGWEKRVKAQNFVWESPSLSSKDSMPIGNGDIGINIWNDPSGDLMLYVGKTDAFDESCRLLKLGRLRLHFANNPFAKGQPFRQELDLLKGEIRIKAGTGDSAVALRIWVDANHPAIHVETTSVTPIQQTVKLELWRTAKQPLLQLWEKHAVDGMTATEPPMQYPDTIVDTTNVPGLTNQLVWYHRNEISIYPATLKLQEIDPTQCGPDPLLRRTFGCSVWGDGWTAKNSTTLQTSKPASQSHIIIHVLTEQTADTGIWLRHLSELVRQNRALTLETCRAEHQQWWHQFWSRSWVCVSSGNPQETADITRGWHLHRYLTACTARGNAPIKFNGAIFNVDGIDTNGVAAPALTADARAWGPAFWNQNERHIYWPMLAAGDYEQLLPFFKMYRDALLLAKARTHAYYGHDGAFFPETMYLWGTYLNGSDCGYGWNRSGKTLGVTDNNYIRYHWQGGIEVTAMMLEYYQHTGDKKFARDTLLPIAEQIVTFYDQHYKRDAQDQIRFEPAQMLETFWNVVNPMPEIAGLHCILAGLADLPDDLVTEAQRNQWKRVLAQLPALPMAKVGNTPILINAQIVRGNANNIENGSLYAVWPYKRLGVVAGDLKLAQDSYANRWHKGEQYHCWINDTIYAAYCGLAKEATDHLASRFVRTDGLRYPTFYTTGDWVPDLDNGGVCQNTIQSMLMQSNGKRIVLLPAWPKEWNASFRLHAPDNTTVEGHVKNGKIIDLNITPEIRRHDVEIMAAQ